MADSQHSSTCQHNSQDSTGEVVVLAVEDNWSRPSKHEFSEDEEILIARMFNLVGERWALIAGRIPGRSAQEIEKYWIARCSSSTQWKDEN